MLDFNRGSGSAGFWLIAVLTAIAFMFMLMVILTLMHCAPNKEVRYYNSVETCDTSKYNCREYPR